MQISHLKDQKNILVFNGEIYNYKEIRNQLPDKNYSSSSDTAVLFHALQVWGIEKTLSKIEGMFAFSWYDIASNELILARDRIGIKPLFYGIDNYKTIWFASEMKALLAVSTFEINPAKVLYSSMGILEKSLYETAWKNIFSRKTAHLLE